MGTSVQGVKTADKREQRMKLLLDSAESPVTSNVYFTGYSSGGLYAQA